MKMADNLKRETQGNELAVYQPCKLDLAHHIQSLQAPISTLNPETRIVSNGDMYTGGSVKYILTSME